MPHYLVSKLQALEEKINTINELDPSDSSVKQETINYLNSQIDTIKEAIVFEEKEIEMADKVRFLCKELVFADNLKDLNLDDSIANLQYDIDQFFLNNQEKIGIKKYAFMEYFNFFKIKYSQKNNLDKKDLIDCKSAFGIL